MREIKFRAWDEARHEFDYKPLQGIANWSFASGALEATSVYEHHQYSCPLMQYTGLKDKNGVEIYEGDIVTYNFIRPFDGKEITGEGYAVEFGEWEHDPDDGTVSHWHYGWNINSHGEDLIVIGNIYENKDLLNESL